MIGRRGAASAALVLGVVVLGACEPDASPPDEQAARLHALGYVPLVEDDPDPSRRGVSLHDPDRSQPGVNVYCSVGTSDVHFVDAEGLVLHEIRLPDAGEGSDCLLEPLGGGEFLALATPNLTRIDWNSRVRWISRRAHHHDVSVGPDGRIYALSQNRQPLRHEAWMLPILDHSVLVLDARGRRTREVFFSRLLRDFIPASRLERLVELLRSHGSRSQAFMDASDLFHANTVEVLERDLGFAKRGQLLVCLRELDLVAVVDLESEAVVWSWGPGELDRPHQPTLLEQDTLLVFDNGMHRGHSRILELDPEAGEIVWEYRGDPPESFFTRERGGAQALANGNVLVTESSRGRVFEVTRRGEIVWEFWNPDFSTDGRRRQIYRMYRVPLTVYEAWAGSD